jgi:hypothetical protein
MGRQAYLAKIAFVRWASIHTLQQDGGILRTRD